MKNCAYTSLIAAKSFISLINTVVLTTLSVLVPAASRRLERFAKVEVVDNVPPAPKLFTTPADFEVSESEESEAVNG